MLTIESIVYKHIFLLYLFDCIWNLPWYCVLLKRWAYQFYRSVSIQWLLPLYHRFIGVLGLWFYLQEQNWWQAIEEHFMHCIHHFLALWAYFLCNGDNNAKQNALRILRAIGRQWCCTLFMNGLCSPTFKARLRANISSKEKDIAVNDVPRMQGTEQFPSLPWMRLASVLLL